MFEKLSFYVFLSVAVNVVWMVLQLALFIELWKLWLDFVSQASSEADIRISSERKKKGGKNLLKYPTTSFFLLQITVIFWTPHIIFILIFWCKWESPQELVPHHHFLQRATNTNTDFRTNLTNYAVQCIKHPTAHPMTEAL